MTNYARGRRIEYRARDDLARAGYVVIRAAGSHGAADLCALKDGCPPLLVQIKRGTLRREHFAELNGIARVLPSAQLELWHWTGTRWRKWRRSGRRWYEIDAMASE